MSTERKIYEYMYGFDINLGEKIYLSDVVSQSNNFNPINNADAYHRKLQDFLFTTKESTTVTNNVD